MSYIYRLAVLRPDVSYIPRGDGLTPRQSQISHAQKGPDMAETLGKAAKKPRQKPLSERQAEAETGEQSNVVHLQNAPSEDHLAKTLLEGVAELRKLDDKIATQMLAVKNTRADRKAVVAKLGAAGLPASLVKEAMEDADNTRTDQAEKEKARGFIRGVFGLATADWSAAFDGLPTGAAEEVDWEARGYTAGVMADDRTPPEGCPPERQPNWLKGYDAAQTKRAMEIKPVSGAFN
jgi:hypothetical protein